MRLSKVKTNWVTVIDNVDINNLTDDERREIYFLFSERKVLIFKNQQIENHKLKEFCSIFGNVWDLSTGKYSGLSQTKTENIQDNFVEIVSERGLLNNKQLPWHIDLTHYPSQEIPNRILYAVNIEGNSAGTRFVDTIQGLKLVDNTIKNLLISAKAICRAPYETPWNFPIKRPVFNFHPYHNDYGLIADELFTEYIDGITEKDTHREWFHKHILEKIISDETEYVHNYEVGDLVVYDNSSTIHSRSAFEGIRRLKRVTWDHDWHKYKQSKVLY
jgi:taurine dioxygenase